MTVEICGTTRLAGVMGWPVTRSRSPRLRNYWLGRYRIDGAYVPLPRAAAIYDLVYAPMETELLARTHVLADGQS